MMIRKGALEDIDKIMELSRRAHEESPYRAHACDEDHIRRMVLLALTMPNFCVFLAEENGEIVGMVVGALSNNAFGMMTASDLITYSTRPGPGAFLYRRFLQWARSGPAVLITVSNSWGEARFDDFLSKNGLKQVGGLFVGETR